MNIFTILFFIFSSLLCVSALQTILVKNPVHAVLFLILSFISASALFIMQGAEFLGLMLILVYVGAVMVLFLFVVMMLDIKALEHLKQNIKSYIPMMITIGFLLLAQIMYILYKSNITKFTQNNISPDLSLHKISNTQALGKLLFTQYLFAFEIAGCILLVGIIIAVVLTIRSRKDTKVLDVTKQINIDSKDRIMLVDSKITDKA